MGDNLVPPLAHHSVRWMPGTEFPFVLSGNPFSDGLSLRPIAGIGSVGEGGLMAEQATRP